MRALTNMVELGRVRRSKFYSHCMTYSLKQNQICKKCNCKENQLPIILKNDKISKYLRLSPGDVCEITRKSIKVGQYPFYRICK